VWLPLLPFSTQEEHKATVGCHDHCQRQEGRPQKRLQRLELPLDLPQSQG